MVKIPKQMESKVVLTTVYVVLTDASDTVEAYSGVMGVLTLLDVFMLLNPDDDPEFEDLWLTAMNGV